MKRLLAPALLLLAVGGFSSGGCSPEGFNTGEAGQGAPAPGLDNGTIACGGDGTVGDTPGK